MHNSGLNETAEMAVLETTALPLSLRRMTYADLPIVISIERRSFPGPWSPGMFVLEMSKESSITLVATRAERPLAYAVFSRYDIAWHLMNIAVAPEHRRHHIASALVEGALAEIDPEAPITLEVRPSNHSAIALYETFGFQVYGLRKGYYSDNGEDAMIMWRGDPSRAGVAGRPLANDTPLAPLQPEP